MEEKTEIIEETSAQVDKLTAEIEQLRADLERSRQAVSKANSESAEWKRKHKALLSDEEKAQAERDEQFKAMSEELEALRKEKTINSFIAKYVALGYSEELAMETAQAMADGDTDKVFENQTKFLAEHDKSVQVSRLQTMPKPVGGSSSVGKSREEIMQIKDATERQKAIQENLDLFS